MATDRVKSTVRDTLWSGLAVLFVPFAFLSVPAYPLLQLFTLWNLSGPSRLLSTLPLAFMLPVYAFCLYVLTQDSTSGRSTRF